MIVGRGCGAAPNGLDASGRILARRGLSGIGIPTGHIEQIANAFITTKATGAGMGLAISRTIA